MLPFGPILVALTGAAVGTYTGKSWLKNEQLDAKIFGYNAQAVVGVVGGVLMMFMGGLPALMGAAALGAAASSEVIRRDVSQGVQQLALKVQALETRASQAQLPAEAAPQGAPVDVPDVVEEATSGFDYDDLNSYWRKAA
jgi:hypothetical protein